MVEGGIVPGILMGSAVVGYSETQIEKLQTIENRVYRQILGAAGYVANAAPRGEVGSSLVRTRIMQARIMFAKGILEGKDMLLKQALEDMKVRNNPWHKTLMRYLRDVGMAYDDLVGLNREKIKNQIGD